METTKVGGATKVGGLLSISKLHPFLANWFATPFASLKISVIVGTRGSKRKAKKYRKIKFFISGTTFVYPLSVGTKPFDYSFFFSTLYIIFLILNKLLFFFPIIFLKIFLYFKIIFKSFFFTSSTLLILSVWSKRDIIDLIR